MSNEPDPTPAPDELMPPELREVEHLLDDDAIEWRVHVPDAEALSRRLRGVLSAANGVRDFASAREASMSDPVSSTTTQPATPQMASAKRSSGPRGVPVPLAAVAAMLVVALLAGVFAVLGQTHSRLGGDTATATTTAGVTAPPATMTPTETELKLPLQAGSPMTGLTGTPVVAPSDPQVIYEYADNGSGVVARRSNNGGQTWGNLLLPNFTGFVSAIELAVNPADANNVFLRLTLGYPRGQKSPCASVANGARASLGGTEVLMFKPLLPASNSSICTNVYASSDGGGKWTLVRLPISGSLFQTGVTFTYDATIFQANGGTLYGRVWQLDSSGVQTGDIRIVRSEDEGQTWSDADAALKGKVSHICAFSASAAGLFAVTSAANCWDWKGGARSVWRSDDRGGLWTRVGDLPAVVAQPGSMITSASGAPSLLYAWPALAGMTSVAQIQASADGGHTWTGAPSSGLPKGARPLLASATTLSIGSLVVAFTTSTTNVSPQGGSLGTASVLAWHPGETAWRRATPDATISGPYIANLYVSTSQPLTVTISVPDDFTSDPTYTLLPFA